MEVRDILQEQDPTSGLQYSAAPAKALKVLSVGCACSLGHDTEEFEFHVFR